MFSQRWTLGRRVMCTTWGCQSCEVFLKKKEIDAQPRFVAEIVLETNRRPQGDPVSRSNDPGKVTGYAGKGKGARGRSAVADQGACSFQFRAPLGPTLILTENDSWADASETSVAARGGSERRLALPGRDASATGAEDQGQADRVQHCGKEQSRE